ncbi:hypothetical protein TPCV302_04930 [Cutibacterium avidum]|nr:hypothetical protein TPCV302_04930 [Cutibacterium avidum]
MGKGGVMPGNTNKRYPAELRTRAVRMYHETRPNYDRDWPPMVKVAELEQTYYAGHTQPQKELELSHH